MTEVKNVAPFPTSRKSITDEMSEAYILYGVSVVVSRAIPDVRDGMKPVHRHILDVLFNRYPPSGPYRKSARAVGEIMGELHPHGDTAIYDAMIKMAQEWNMSMPLVDIQGNKGSIDGDSPAAMRYTEMKTARVADVMLSDLRLLDPKRPEMVNNYDNTIKTPSVMPCRVPNILINGGRGIAVGMASSFPPHNLAEVVDATIAMMDNPEITLEEIMRIMPGPDFPVGCKIMGVDKIHAAYSTGRGPIPMEGEATIEEGKGSRSIIVVKSLPFQVRKDVWLESIAEIVRNPDDDRLDGIADIVDLSQKGFLVHIIVKQGVDPNIVLNKLKRHTALSSNFSVNMTCLNNRRPECMNLLDILKAFIQFRIETIYDRTEYQQNQLRNNINRAVAFWIARRNSERFIDLVKGSADRQETIKNILEMGFDTTNDPDLYSVLSMVDPDAEVPDMFYPSHYQATILADQKITFLTRLELDRIQKEIETTASKIRELEILLANPEALKNLMKEEMREVVAKYRVARRSPVEVHAPGSVTDLDLIEEKQVLVTMTQNGYIKLTDVNLFRDQNRGGRGKNGMQTRDDDNIMMAITCSNKTNLLVFTEKGMSYSIPTYTIEMGSPTSKGKYIANYLGNMSPDDRVTNIMVQPEDEDGKSIVFVTNDGSVRRNDVESFAKMNVKGKTAMKLEGDTRIVSVFIADETQDICIYTSDNKAVRFPVADLRVMTSRTSTGVRGVILGKGAVALGAMSLPHVDIDPPTREAWKNGGTAVIKSDANAEPVTITLTPEQKASLAQTEVFILTITEDGYGKRFSSHDLRVTDRGCRGVAIGPDKKRLLLCRSPSPEESIAIITDSGQTIRMRSDAIRMTKARDARGTLLLKVDTGTKIVDCSVIINEEEEE